MAKNIEIIIDNVKHKLVKGSHITCGNCSIKEYCTRGAEKDVFICFRLSGRMNCRFEKEELNEQKPVEWSDEDYVMQRAALEIVMASPKLVASTILKESVIVWLQSLKDRLQPKQEWSEEDENRVDQICEDLKCGLINFYANKNVKGLHFDEIIESNIDWLKNKLKYLKPQNKKWKPSKKQMKDLAFVADQNKGNMVGKTMISLYKDLTKLMEE